MKPVLFENVTLEPLRREGLDALDTGQIPGLEKVTLEEIGVEWDDDAHQVLTRHAENLFHFPHPIPRTGTLTYARFAVHFASTTTPGLVELRPPDTIACDTHCEPALVARWAIKHHFAKEIQN